MTSPEPSFDLAALVDAISAGILGLDGGDRVTFVNESGLAILRRERHAVERCDVVAAVGGDEELRRSLESCAGDGRLSFPVLRGDGSRIEVGFTIMRPSRPTPHVDRVLLFRDLEQQEQLDEEQRRLERLQAVARMVAGFAHEVRNPLAGLQGLAESLEAELAEDDGRRQYASRSLALLARIEGFVRTSLEFARPPAPRLARTRPEELVLPALAARFRRSRIADVVVEAPGRELPFVYLDAAQASSALCALVDNAVEAEGKQPPRIELVEERAEDGRRWVCIAVSDHGAGIPAEHRARVFDPFFTTKPKALGLGLAVAQTLAAQNGGRLRLRSGEAGGTVAALLFPAFEPLEARP